MEIGKTLYVKSRKEWRRWLAKNHAKAKEIWLIYFKKHTGKPRIPYNDAVEEALCYGWIDSTAKRVDDERTAQRYTPRREGSGVSEMNLERARRLVKNGRMTRFGIEKIKVHLMKKSELPEDIIRAVRKDAEAWANYRKFSDTYKRIRIGFIEGARGRPKMFKRRLEYFLKMTKKGKKFGMVQ